MFDLGTIKSHSDKSLFEHIDGVRNNVKMLSNSKIAELVAVFHDLGKMNPNFQMKLLGKSNHGYSKHSLLSAYTFFCMCVSNKANFKLICDFVDKTLNTNDVVAITIMIAKHHGDLPDFVPGGIEGRIISDNETSDLFTFLYDSDFHVFDYVKHYFRDVTDFTASLKDPKIMGLFEKRFVFSSRGKDNSCPRDFFMTTQSSFADVLVSDKIDAGKLNCFIEKQSNDIKTFATVFCNKLDAYLSLLNQDSDINKLRTQIRFEAVTNLSVGLKENRHGFELTAPTGSGKTLMLLSLASEIIKEKGPKRIIYGLPFLSITEQVESDVLNIFDGYENFIQRIDSKSENKHYETILKEMDEESDEEKIKELNVLDFQETSFSYPFIITTFVRFFETILSNRNSELLKLPNFSNCIFLLDEIQALPPRLYGFFVAYLTRFCELFDSYVIVSTATQPNFELPKDNENAKRFFCNYKKPYPLLPLGYFDNELFNRYVINYQKDFIELEDLKEQIFSENKSVLVILNTIDDTKDLYNLLSDELLPDELILLNTHFTPNDRKQKIAIAKDRLSNNKRIIVISTQLIEAGVNIDFPILYRDFATVSSIVQSAGRCNRNGRLPGKGKVVLFRLRNRDKLRCELIYRGKERQILEITKNAVKESTYSETSLLAVQQQFFNGIQSELLFARYGKELKDDFLKDMQECMYSKIGQFRLIDEDSYGIEHRYYVSEDDTDDNFEVLLCKQGELVELLHKQCDFNIIKAKKKEIEIHLKKMANHIVQVRIRKNDSKPLLANDKAYFDLFHIDKSSYSFEKGVDLAGNEFIF